MQYRRSGIIKTRIGRSPNGGCIPAHLPPLFQNRECHAALNRHKTHIAEAMVKAIERRETSIGESVLYRLEVLYQRGEKILAEAESSGDGRLALASIRELREIQRDSFILATKAAEVGTDGPPQMEIHVIHIGGSPSTEA